MRALPNIDAMTDEELAAFRVATVVKGSGKALFGPCKRHEMRTRKEAARDAYCYARDIGIARELRIKGDIHGASIHERTAEYLYSRLPKELRW